MTKIKAGIIGTGFIGPAHVEALRRLGFVEVAAVSERDQALAQRKADELSIPKAYGDYKQLLADPEIQVVHNCTPNHLHFEVNRDILAAGKHVVSEKPLAMNSTESKELVRLAAKAGVVNAIDFNYRYMPLVQQARAMCQNHDDVGRVLAVHGSYLQDWLFKETDWNWRLVPELSGDSRADRRRRQPLVRSHSVRHRAEDRPRDGRPRDDPPEAEAAEGRGRDVRRQGAQARGDGRRGDRHRGLRVGAVGV